MRRKTDSAPRGAGNFAEPEQVEEAFRNYGESIYRLSIFYLQNRADAEDAVQTVFLQLFRSNPLFREEEHRKAWLLKTAANCCMDMLRARKAYPEEPDKIFQILGRGRNGEAEEKQDETLELLLKLPDLYKIPLYLYYYEGYSCEEIARMLGKKNGTVRSLLLRGRRKLQEYLKGGAE